MITLSAGNGEVETSEVSMAKYNSFNKKRKGVKNTLGYQ